MTKPLLAILLLLPLSVSAGELDGKFLICEHLNVEDSVREDIDYSPFYGFEFINGDVYGETIIVNGTRAIIVPFLTQSKSTANPLSYRATLNTVSWGDGFWVLDRQTLRLEGNSKGDDRKEMRCEVFTEVLPYKKRLGNLQDEKQMKIDELTKNNKI